MCYMPVRSAGLAAAWRDDEGDGESLLSWFECDGGGGDGGATEEYGRSQMSHDRWAGGIEHAPFIIHIEAA